MFLKSDKIKSVTSGIARTQSQHARFERPFLNVSAVFDRIYAQIFDYKKGVTFFINLRYKEFVSPAAMIEDAKKVGAAIAKKALEMGITEVASARAANILTDEEKALLKAAREAGLKF